MNNQEIAELLRNVAAAYEISGESKFRINAYTQASDSIALLPSNVQDVWKSGKLKDIPGIGGSIAGHLEELFTKGHVKHFDELFASLPNGTFELMKIRTIGPKTAVKLALELKNEKYKGKTIYERLEDSLNKKSIQEIEGFGEKRQDDICHALEQFKQGQRKKKRMLLNEADQIAQKICSYLLTDKNVSKVDVLGSLRRKKDTIGDIDVACVTRDPTTTLNHFVSYLEIKTVVDKGLQGATIITSTGVQVDLRIAEDKTYGAMLQYFTGSKYHNIKLREYALSQGLSISEYGIKNVKSGKKKRFDTELMFYKYLGLPLIPAEMREDRGEIELALQSKLPVLVEEKDIKGDIHMHSNFDLTSSHDVGISTVEEFIALADQRRYEYIGFSDHNPKASGLSAKKISDILKRRKKYLEHKFYSNKIVQNKKSVQKLFVMLEVDIKPDGKLALPDEAFLYVDAILVSIHSSFTLDKDKMTERILKALSYHPKVRIFAHPTARLINNRNGIEVYWEEVFKVCKERDIALEINASPNRLDLPDTLVWEARQKGIKFVIGTDSHEVNSMQDMKYGVWVGRRGWTTKRDILNTRSVDEFSKWLLRS